MRRKPRFSGHETAGARARAGDQQVSAQTKDPVAPSPHRGAPGRSGSTLARGLAVLAVIAERGEVRAGELAAAVELPVSTVYRYLRLLREHGFVVDRDGVYGRGPRLTDTAAPSSAYARLAQTAAPLMQRLTTLTGETVTLAVRVGSSHALCVHQTESPNAEHTAFRIGQVLPLHAGAGERVLLAFAPREVIQLALVGELERFTDNTPRRDELLRKIASTRSSWLTTSRAEYVPGALAVAV
ncbi:MAG: IclR family transcriptional regulator, partial [Trebonia sp.]